MRSPMDRSSGSIFPCVPVPVRTILQNSWVSVKLNLVNVYMSNIINHLLLSLNL